MSKITEVKYLRVSLKLPTDNYLIKRFPEKWVRDGQYIKYKGMSSDSAERDKVALDDAYAEMEAKVNTYLKLGWVLNGSVVWNYIKKHKSLHGYGSGDELFQTMVKYELPKSTTANLLSLLDRESCKD